ncbi:MAG: glycosyltransferase family 39 protein [Candidatus Peribacteraceae bacterium]|jgi:4-amino-4-deoxy-L-arabinose transferase-like glycosyltransferase|nr:glycosyltransferase family 39 protein [Candidatus Peribacteraceae bacterium]
MRMTCFRRLAQWLPECLLLALFLFFALRDLGTFPAAWADDSLFMIVAKSVAEGDGYGLPILGYFWPHPYILAVGPTLLYPVALAIRLFGFSVGIARIPMVLFLLGTTIASYLFVRRTVDRTAARWTAALMISFSAFINTGKPVLGEVPGFFFIIVGLLLMQREMSPSIALMSGAAFGLAVMTKLPFGLVLPALILAWIVAAIRLRGTETRFLLVAAASTAGIALIGSYWMGILEPGFFDEIRIFLFEKKSVVPEDAFVSIIARPRELLRAAYGHYVLVAVLAGIGWWTVRSSLRGSLSVILFSIIALFALYFLNGPGWYRALLPSTLLLFLFVPAGARKLLGRTGATLLLSGIVIAQGYWQYTGGGSSDSPEAADAAQALIAEWQERDLVILSPEVFVRLPRNDRWLFLSEELRHAERQPPEVRTRLDQSKCLPVFRKESYENLETKRDAYRTVSGRYIILDPPSDCPQP